MRRILGAVTAGAVVALIASVPAAAYVHSGGTGVRSDPVTAGQPLTVSGSTARFGSSAKVGDAVALTATVSNPNGFHLWAHRVTVQFGGTNAAGCGGADYQINGSPASLNRAVTGHGSLPVPNLSVTLKTKACNGSTVTLAYTVD